MKHSNLARQLSCGLSAALLFACAFAARVEARQAKAIDFAELESAVEAELKAGHTPGAAVAVVSGDRVVYAKGFGVTSAEGDGAAVTPDTLFRMGSTTKMFTAAALVTLAAEGKIRLDAPVGDFVKNLPPKLAALTAHQLLSQSSGLRDFAPAVTSDDDAALGKNIRAWNDEPFFTEPNRIYSYSSPNYWLAGFVVEELTGRAYSDAMRELVFKPLGMRRTTLRPLEAMTYPLALGHNVEKNSAVVIRPVANNVAKYPGGSIYSSVNELARFAVAMMNGGRLEGRQALAPLVVGELPKPQPPPDAGEMRRYVGKYAHAPQTWEVFVKDGKLFLKEDGKDFELTKLGRDLFGYEQGQVLFVPDERGTVGHIFMGLYAARRTP